MVKKRLQGFPADISVSLLAQLVRYLSSLGLDFGGILRSAGVDPGMLANPDSRISAGEYIAVEEAAVRASGDAYFGLHMGEFFEPGHWSLLGYLMMNCATLGEAFRKSARYSRIIGTLIEVEQRIGLRSVKAVMRTPRGAPPLSRHCFEGAISSGVRMMRILSGSRISPLEVGFRYPAPASTEEYRRILGCPVLFGREETYVSLDMRLARIPALAPNPALLERFEAYAREFTSRTEGLGGTAGIATRRILSRLDDPGLSARRVARDMSMSVRTLQNRLKEEGFSFSGLLEGTRERLAKERLSMDDTVEDITYMLGFSDPSAFRKAFKRWSGMTPKEYREKARGSDIR